MGGIGALDGKYVFTVFGHRLNTKYTYMCIWLYYLKREAQPGPGLWVVCRPRMYLKCIWPEAKYICIWLYLQAQALWLYLQAPAPAPNFPSRIGALVQPQWSINGRGVGVLGASTYV